MKTLNKNETFVVAGGNGDDHEKNTDKVKDVINDGLDDVADNLDKLSEKIHDKVQYHRCK